MVISRPIRGGRRCVFVLDSFSTARLPLLPRTRPRSRRFASVPEAVP